MSPIPLLIALSSVGIDAGWEPLPDGGLQYTVQIEPQQVRMLKPGYELVSEIPPKSRDIRRIRITVGTEKLARTDPPATPEGKDNVVVAKPAVVPATATEPIAGPRFPDDPPAVANKPAEKISEKIFEKTPENIAQESPQPDPQSDTSRSEALASETSPSEKHVAGYPKVETALATLSTSPTGDDDKFGWPFLATAAGLIASLGVNLFLAWIAWGAYGKYRSLARRMNSTAAPV